MLLRPNEVGRPRASAPVSTREKPDSRRPTWPPRNDNCHDRAASITWEVARTCCSPSSRQVVCCMERRACRHDRPSSIRPASGGTRAGRCKCVICQRRRRTANAATNRSILAVGRWRILRARTENPGYQIRLRTEIWGTQGLAGFDFKISSQSCLRSRRKDDNRLVRLRAWKWAQPANSSPNPARIV